ncbi:MAG: cache domain-containing protein, partial [Desulfobacteraceae bacterium]|nr:cache domain-containing protein [Desulfobacteraceae bacterium]
ASLRIIVPLYITYALFVLSVFAVFLPRLENHLMEQKKQMIRGLTDTTWSLLSEYHDRVVLGELSLEKAQQMAISQVRNLRYGNETKDYFWIIDMQTKVIMHPFASDLEGKDQTDLTDSSGKHFLVDFVKTAVAKDSGYVDYMWQWENGVSRVAPKISYVKRFSPWNWVVGTGLYVDDIKKEIGAISQGFLKIFLGVLGIVLLMSFYITWQTLKIEKKKNIAEKEKHLDELRLKKLLELSRMSEASLSELSEFSLEEAIQMTQSEIGFLAFLSEDETFLTMHIWSNQVMKQCEIKDKFVIYDIEKSGLWVEALRKRDAVIINDYNAPQSYDKKGYPQGHVAIHRFMSIPIFNGQKIVALVGVGNKKQEYVTSDLRQLTLIMNGMWKIIERKQFEDRLRDSEERYRILAENATDNIWILRLSDLTFSYMSPSVEQILGYLPEEIIGRKIGSNMTDSSLKKTMSVISEELIQNLEKNNEIVHSHRFEQELIRKDGTKIWAETTARVLKDNHGKPDRILGITRDITERVTMGKRLQQAQKMEALGTLAGGIAHDFNNILSSVLGFTELVKLNVTGDVETKKNLDQILAAGMRARDLVGHILTFSRRSDVQNHPIQITPLIKECLKFVRASFPSNIEIKQAYNSTDGLVMADPTQIHQVLMNLFTNAAHAMKGKGGILDVRLESVDIQPNHTFQTKKLSSGSYLQLTVTDTGCGIQKEIMDRIFEPFFTTKGRNEGTGMGLATVYGIIKGMQGAVFVNSEPKMGTTFQILFPQYQGKILTKTAAIDFFSLTGKEKILLVDDEESIVNWTRQLLSKLGYEITCMTDSIQSFERFRQNPDEFDLVLTDMTMPRMNGLELSRRISGIRPDLPIILCTGFNEGLTADIIKDNGILDMIMKPMIATELALAVSKALGRKV